MGKSNRGARKELEIRYGKGCMFIKGDVEERTKRKLKKTYKKFKEERHYTRKEERALETLMTYHHLKHKSKGGKATVENGAIVNSLAHQYIHSLSRQEEEIINNELRCYKAKIDGIKYIEFSPEEVKQAGQITFEDLGVGYETISLENNTKEDVEFLQLSEEEQELYNKYLEERRKRVQQKFNKNPALDTNIRRGKAYIDDKWQKQIIQDLEDEFNERNRGGYGR